MTLPIDRTAKAVIDANLVNGILSDGPKLKANDDVIYNTIDELYNYTTGLISAGTLSRLGVVNVHNYNASGAGTTTTTGSIATGLKALTVASTSTFEVGHGISVAGAGTAGALFVSSIASINGLVITLADAAITTVTGAVVLHDDTAALQAALNVTTASEIRFGSSDNNYIISSGLTAVDGVLINLEECTISANFATGYILSTKYYASGKKTFKIIGNRAILSGYGVHSTSSTLHGLYIDSCNFSYFKHLVIQGCEYPVILGPTGAEDIKSIVIEGIETNTARGLKILAGDISGTDYQETTDGTIRDCFWTCTGSGGKALEVIVEDHADTSVSSVFGLSFIRCSFNPTHSAGGTMIDMRAGGSSSIYGIRFDNCEGEIRYAGTTPTIPLIYLDTVNESEFEVRGYYHKADGVQLVNSRNNVFKNMIDGITDTTNTGRFIVLDSTSNSNYFENCGFLLNEMSTELGITNAPLSAYWFKTRIVDDGQLNSFSGMITSHPQRIFRTDALKLISSTGSDLLNPLVSGQASTSSWVKNADGTFTLTTTTEAGFYFRVPTEIPLGTKIVYRIKYKFNSTLGSLAGWCIKTSSDDGSVRTVPMSMTATYTDQMFLGVATTRENRIMSTSSQTNVILQIEKLEMFIGGFPYPYNYAPADIVRDNFLENPYLDTSLRPAHSNVYIGWTYYDTALEKLVSSNGTQWRSNGSIV